MRKKTIRLPNGYGQIRKLTGKRRNPYGVYPPQTEDDEEGRRRPVKALCYVSSWTVAFTVLTAYKAGKYVPGMELTLTDSPDTLQAALADYATLRRAALGMEEPYRPTFADVYEMYYKDKFETGREYSKASVASVRAGYNNCAALHDLPIADIKLDDLQRVVDECPLKRSSAELIALVIKQVYRYAEAHELTDRDLGKFVQVKRPDDDEHGVPFTEQELATLWQNRDDPTVEMILIMCFAGYRISAYKDMVVNLDEKYFLGGNKTTAGKNLMIPIHSGIYDLVERRMQRYGSLLPESAGGFRRRMYETLERLSIPKHTPHDCKHTFSALCERYNVTENDRKRMLGHAVGNITNDIYGHRNLDDLRAEIEKIQPLIFVK